MDSDQMYVRDLLRSWFLEGLLSTGLAAIVIPEDARHSRNPLRQAPRKRCSCWLRESAPLLLHTANPKR